MTRTMLRIALAAGLTGAFLAACHPRCRDLCDHCQATSPGRTAPGSCADACDELDGLSSSADCGDPWDAYVSCMDSGCDPKACGGERAAYAVCLHDYCAAHPEDDRCDVVL